MLGKLMKYEWKGYKLPIIILLIILAGTTALTCGIILSINPKYDDVVIGYSAMALMLSIFLYYFGIIGCTLGTMLIVTIRFYKTCYTDQGYLTHTLPVSPILLLNSKLITAILTYLLMLVAIVGSLFIIINVAISHVVNMAVYELDIISPDKALIREQIREAMSEFFTEFGEMFGINFGSFITILIIFTIISCIANIISIFGCVSLGQLYAKHRVLGAIAAYFILQIVESIIGYISSIPMYAKIMRAEISNYEITPFGLFSPNMYISLAITVVIAVILYFANLHMMTKRLNLE